MPVLAFNKRVNFDYDIQETYEAGLVLLGYEVKSIKTGHVSLKGSYVAFKKIKNKNLPEAYLINAHIPLYKFAGDRPHYNPTRSRKLLLKKKEIAYLIGKKAEQGLTLAPIKIYTKHSFIKLEFGVGKGRKKYDKREVIKKREFERQVRTLTKRGL
ncbi:SsrA-binding protein SmpB [Patescibacteria group bacterium]|nr:SsrA-binding protein SmpB [Patescibacteria group bacterium]MBU1663299.1 SsrA-binding protein SmpB [Patescibacteria group bacterium]MBU1933906.1 SsrA-binding protein SmpB [Patescibacteria group bacterium]MBU2007565.1 SsrA-binding protein SmpB [Patescibacteria group bacterium]MBU2233540.1 SsrA-binding protein SmpB [Patescibacteria group bacterium]